MTTPEEVRTLVAEVVMGWRADVWHGWECWLMPEVSGKSQRMRRENWNPLESWADAGRVIERMVELGYDLELEVFSIGMAWAHFLRSGEISLANADDRRFWSGACEAISLAALHAQRVEVE